MNRFQLKPTIYEFDAFSSFTESFEIGNSDLIFTEKFFSMKYIQGNADCRVLFQDDYGLGEPKDTVIDKILKDIKNFQFDRLIGIGGGTVLDIAKLLCVKDAQTTEDIFSDVLPLVRDKGLVLIPTTCGTGCEMTCVSVVDMTKRGSKIGKRIEANFADSAVLIPELLNGIPESVFQYSSIDALIHAMEIFVAPTGNPYNDVFCKSSIDTILRRYRILSVEGLEKRFDFLKEFLRASAFAGIALSNTACGAVHAMAMHFGSAHHVPHGESNARFFIPVFQKYMSLSPKGKIVELAGIIKEALELSCSVEETFEEVGNLIDSIIPKKRLSEYGVREESIEWYVDTVIETQKRLLKNNFVPLSREDLIDIYRGGL